MKTAPNAEIIKPNSKTLNLNKPVNLTRKPISAPITGNTPRKSPKIKKMEPILLIYCCPTLPADNDYLHVQVFWQEAWKEKARNGGMT